MALTGNPAGVPGEDGYHNALLARHLRDEERREAWDEAVESKAQELQSEDPDLSDEEAQDMAEDALLEEIKWAEDERAAAIMEERG